MSPWTTSTRSGYFDKVGEPLVMTHGEGLISTSLAGTTSDMPADCVESTASTTSTTTHVLPLPLAIPLPLVLFEIFVDCQSGVLALDVSGDCTITKVKIQIFGRSDLPVDLQRL